jgi:hypothetical protein
VWATALTRRRSPASAVPVDGRMRGALLHSRFLPPTALRRRWGHEARSPAATSPVRRRRLASSIWRRRLTARFRKYLTGVAGDSWVDWWEKQKGDLSAHAARTYGTSTRACTSAARALWAMVHMSSTKAQHGFSRHATNGFSEHPAAWTYEQWLQRLECDCPYQDGAQMRMQSRGAQSRIVGGGRN